VVRDEGRQQAIAQLRAQVDVGRWAELVKNSEFWKQLSARLNERLSSKLDALPVRPEGAEMLKAVGRIAELRDIMALPDEVIAAADEAKKQLSEMIAEDEAQV
jgi:hypothetical protein